MVKQGYHREIWHVFTLAACATSGELLVEACQQAGGKGFGWSGHRWMGRCADPDCRGTAASLRPATVPEADRPGLALAAALVHPSTSINRTALASLPESLRQENRGDLFELAWLLGCLDHTEGSKAIMSPADFSPVPRSEMLARGAARMLTWPSCLADVLRRSAEGNEASTSVKRVVETVQAIVRKPMTFGRPATLLAAELEGISTNAFSAVVGQQLGLLTATEFSRVTGLKNSKMAVLQRSDHLPRVLFSEGGRDIALFSPSDATDVRRRIGNRLPAQVFGSETGLGIDAVKLLVGEKVLSLADDPIIQALWPEPHLDPADATDLRERITRNLKRDPAPDGSVKLSAALHGCPAGYKPWPAIIEALLAGRLSLHHSGKKKLDVRSCLISQQDMRTLHSLRLSSACPDTRSEWLSEADARERLSTTGRRLRSLVEAKRLSTSGSFSGLTYRRSEIDAIAAAWVSTLELQAKLGISWRDLSTILRAARLIVDEHRLVPRDAAREKLGLPLV